MPPSNASQPKWLLPFAVRCFLCFGIILFFTLVCRPHPVEDGYIYARYIRNSLNGLGLVFNIGEHINALTSPLYSYALLALSWMMHGHILLAERVLYVAFLIGTCFIAEVLFPYAGLLLSSMIYMHVLVGMETSMFLFFILLSILLLQKELYNWLPLCLVLLALSRMEGAAMTPVMLWICYRRKRWPAWQAYILPVAAVVAYLLLNDHAYGVMLPASSSAKIGQGKSGFWGKWPRAFLYGYRLTPDGRPAFYAIFAELAVVPFALKRLRGSAWNAAALPFFLILFSFYVLFNIPAYGWYYAPLILVLVLYGTAEFVQTRVGMAVLLALVVAQSVDAYRMLRHADKQTATPYSAAAEWLNANTAPDATVESLEIGEFGWLTNRYLYDSLGLTLPKNADHVAHRDFSSWLEEDKPDYVLYHTTRPFPFERVIVADPNYRPVDYDKLGIMIYKRTGDLGRRGAPLLPAGR